MAKSYHGKYKGQSEIGYKNGRGRLLNFWINLNLIINIIIIAGMISAVFSLEGVVGSSSSSFSWARWVLYAIIAVYIALFIGLVVAIRRENDDSRALMSLFNYRSLSVIARKTITIVYTIFICFVLVDSWVSGIVGSDKLILVIGILIIVFYVLMIGVDVFKIYMRRKIYANKQKKRSERKVSVQSMKKDIECEQILVEQKILEMRALQNSMVFRLLSINRNRYKQSESIQDEWDVVETFDDGIKAEIGIEPIVEAQAVVEDKVSVTMEELQEGVIVSTPTDEIAAAQDTEEEEQPPVVDENQVSFDDIAADDEVADEPYDDDSPQSLGISSLSRDFSDIFDFRSRTGV